MTALPRPPGRTAVLGIINVTPDSFSDGVTDIDAALARAKVCVDQGADALDVGGESTRPGAEPVDAATEIARVVPVIERIVELGVPVSIDTRKAEVARAAIGAGASAVNDVSAGVFDPSMFALVAGCGCEIVLMHMRGTPQTMDDHTTYEDVVADVCAELTVRIDAAVAAGVQKDRIWIDPGLGFAKNATQSLALLRGIEALREMGGPVVVGPSRKRFVGHVTGGGPTDRIAGTAGAVAWCAMAGVEMVRVHDVKVMRDVVDMIAAIK